MASLKVAKVIPDVIDSTQTGSIIRLLLSFGSKTVEEGMLLKPSEAHAEPKVEIEGAAPADLYTLIASDPDAPDPDNPIRREYLHWIVTNIGGNNVASGNPVTSYMGPAPPIGTHRYVFALFKQPNQTPLQIKEPDSRANFVMREFAKQYSLGEPVAATYFLSTK